jgi:hypothetical protein
MAQMRNVHGAKLQTRIEDWFARLDAVHIDRKPAERMYCGSSWIPARKLCAGGKDSVWIVSAGNGLISPETNIPPYAATFTTNHPDSVVPKEDSHFDASDWWIACATRARTAGRPGFLAEIAAANPEQPFVVALSREYFAAVENDLINARNALVDPDLLVLISSGTPKCGHLENNLLPCDSRMEHIVGMGRSALNIRILKLIMDNYRSILRASLLRNVLRSVQSPLDSSTYPQRARATDEEVMAFIRTCLRKEANLSHSGLLRNFRTTGRACEQGRFKELFLHITQ